MVKGKQRYSSMNNGGKWFVHPDSSESEVKSRETCTTTGIMQSQVKMLPQVFNFERYPKWKTQQKPRDDPFSCHDNNASKDNILDFSHGFGRRKPPDDLRQHNSHFCLCDGADSRIETTSSTYRNDFTSMGTVDVANRRRRFPQNHKLRSEEAAKAQAGEQFMWFGQDSANSNISESLEVLAATCHSAPAKS
ncbi:testis-expressed protein 36 [Nematolebias whitei]|uniref:testis-expressed protein 36 n=1 Tax=Nematolebias whitei TaxID=451745 RepID=UPI0018984CDA|nr:testis-expressed protein 36 [Nematolebias whitei]